MILLYTSSACSAVQTSGETIKIEDSLPGGATKFSSGGGVWEWITNLSFSGEFAHKSASVAGVHQHYFNGADETQAIDNGDIVFIWGG